MMTIKNIFHTFVLSRITRAATPNYRGIFYLCPQNTRHCPYLSKPKGAQSPGEGLDKVKGNAVFYCPFLNLSKMSKNSPCVTDTSLGYFTPEEIIRDLVTTDETSRMRQHLRDMLDSYLLSEDESIFRKEIYGTYLALDTLLCKSDRLNKTKMS